MQRVLLVCFSKWVGWVSAVKTLCAAGTSMLGVHLAEWMSRGQPVSFTDGPLEAKVRFATGEAEVECESSGLARRGERS